MTNLVKNVFTGTWKSFKTFRNSGVIKLDTKEQFRQIDFVENGGLIIHHHHNNKVEKVAAANDWFIELKNKKHYLRSVSAKLLYEVITINHSIMVLQDHLSGDKTFFAKESLWPDYLSTNHSIIL